MKKRYDLGSILGAAVIIIGTLPQECDGMGWGNAHDVGAAGRKR